MLNHSLFTNIQSQIIKNINLLQDQTFNFSGVLDKIKTENLIAIRFSAVQTENEANVYIKDLNLNDLAKITNPQEKAYHLYSFYRFLSERNKETEFYPNFVKVFQLAVFFDDNYVYRYYLSWFLFKIGEKELSLFNLKEAISKLKNNEVRVYSELLKEVNQIKIKAKIAELVKTITQEIN